MQSARPHRLASRRSMHLLPAFWRKRSPTSEQALSQEPRVAIQWFGRRPAGRRSPGASAAAANGNAGGLRLRPTLRGASWSRKRRRAAQELANLVSKLAQLTGLHDDRIAEDGPVVRDKLAGKGGHEQHLCLGPDQAQTLGEHPPFTRGITTSVSSTWIG